METQLQLGEILSNAFSTALKNLISLIVNFLLWILTLWIPYLNVGTTIAIFTLPVSLSKGNVISPVEIFDPKYRRYMGEFFMLQGLKSIVLFPALLFMVIPAIVINLSWSISLLLVVDQGKDPSGALSESNRLTYGHKWTIFFTYLILILPFIIPIINIIYFFLYVPVTLSAKAYIYKTLTTPVSQV